MYTILSFKSEIHVSRCVSVLYAVPLGVVYSV